ncbi:Lon protease family protein [Sneathiella sp.]|uniref:Lon protease family protein n=1 Tax=Sneathiella sp. TaxID=1964365 RepID=UPI00356AE19B
MSDIKELTVAQLRRRYDPNSFKFKDTRELKELKEPLGQDRAIEAIRFGIGVRHQGFNLFAFGPSGAGKTEIIRLYLEPEAAKKSVPDDWCYVNNFTAADRPKVLRLPAGRALELAGQMENLADELRVVIAAGFESDEYRTRLDVIIHHLKLRQEKIFEDLNEKAAKKDITLVRTPTGFVLAPVREGKVLDPAAFAELTDEDKEKIKSDISSLEGDLQSTVRMLPEIEREERQETRKLNREVTSFAVDHLLDDIRAKWKDCKAVLAFLDEVQEYVIGHGDVFRLSTEQAPAGFPPGMMPDYIQQREQVISNCQVNVLVCQEQKGGAPVVYEDNPTVENLIGRIEHLSQYGSLITNFRLIKSGALHRANGGYLILDARRLLFQPFAWETLKRELRSREIRIESVSQMMSLGNMVSLQPETIPLDVKVILIGDPNIYYLLSQQDPDFQELFKVPVDFDDRMTASKEVIPLYVRLIASQARLKKLLPLDPSAVALVLERMTRLAGDVEKLSSHVRSLADLLSEADHWASDRGADVISGEDVERAIDAHIHRSDRIRERMQEQIKRGVIMLDTTGEKVGQINGLSVLQLGDFAFGRPSRITARVQIGRGHVIDIEREVELGGPLHSKGVLILSNLLAARFAQTQPLSLNASLVFEQSYGQVDGDSASSTEFYALLSALANVPIRQSLAVTGSTNQFGEVQAIGGVNEKIEGFFDICLQQGLNGEQGVLIPASNVPNLMLNDDVLAAVERGQFHIYPIKTVDEGISLLTGMSAGEADAEGQYPKDSINGQVQARLKLFADSAKKFAREQNGSEDEKLKNG